MRIGIAVKTGGEVLAALLAKLYEAARVPAWVVLLTDANQSGKKAVKDLAETGDQSGAETFDVLLVDVEGRALLSRDGISARLTVVSADDGDCRAAVCVPLHCGRVISFGLNGKSCVTASSVEEEKLWVCLQRAFSDVNGQTVEQREFALRRVSGGLAPWLLIAAASVALCGGLQPDMITAFFAAEDLMA